jgi:flavodoxin
VDDLLCIQYFEYKRTFTRNGNRCEDIIGCKIRELRPKLVSTQKITDSSSEDVTKILNIEGCEYRVPKDEIIAWLEL